MKFRHWVAWSILLFIAACTSMPDVGMTGSTAAPAGVAAASTDADYRLGTGDKLRVIVFGEESLSGEYTVDGSGSVALALVGGVQASGLTAREFEHAVTAAYSDGYLRNPRVSVEVLNYRPFYILGEVKKPGEYAYRNGLTVISAIAAAEGFTYRANTSTVLIDRPGQAEKLRVPASAVTPVLPGDVITVRERFF